MTSSVIDGHPPLALRVMHIAKCAGYSFSRMIASCKVPPISVMTSWASKEAKGNATDEAHFQGRGGEFCYRTIEADHLWPSWHLAPGVRLVRTMLLRSPRAHVASQYTMCRFHPWNEWVGHARPGAPSFPASDVDEPIVGGFRRWLEHFGENWTVARGDWQCYHPRSLQARALTCSLAQNTSQHRVLGNEHSAIFPNAARAILHMRSMSHVGLVDLFPESWCLLLFTVGTRPLPNSCDCEGREAALVRPLGPADPRRLGRSDDVIDGMAHENSMEDTHKLDVSTLPADVLRLIDDLTEADVQLYRAAALRVVRELRDAERSTGMRLLCDTSLKRLTNATRYIHGLAPALWDEK